MLDQKLLETAILTIRDASVRWGWGGFHYRAGTAVRGSQSRTPTVCLQQRPERTKEVLIDIGALG